MKVPILALQLRLEDLPVVILVIPFLETVTLPISDRCVLIMQTHLLPVNHAFD
jgi:hypothetical protein